MVKFLESAKLALAFWTSAFRRRRFCMRWARLESPEYEFMVRHDRIWKLQWRVAFCDLHRWNGEYCHWNGHDVGSGEGNTLSEAWEDMAAKIVEYEHASSEDEAMLKAELSLGRTRPRGWGYAEWLAFYRR